MPTLPQNNHNSIPETGTVRLLVCDLDHGLELEEGVVAVEEEVGVEVVGEGGSSVQWMISEAQSARAVDKSSAATLGLFDGVWACLNVYPLWILTESAVLSPRRQYYCLRLLR